MTQEELYDLIHLDESYRIERTVSTGDMDKFQEAICAFANDLPGHRKHGYLLIGVDDKGHISGLKVDDALMKRISGIRSDGNILPLPVMTTEKVETPEGDVLVVDVTPSFDTPIRYRGRTFVYNYPYKALRELMMNALMHRDYQANTPTRLYQFDDHIEVLNPGGLYGEARPENFPNVNDYRNSVLAEMMKTLNYVNMFNHGIREVKSLLAENGNPAPEFKVDYITAFAVEIPIAKDDEPAVNSEDSQNLRQVGQKSVQKSREKSREKIIGIMRENPAITQNGLVLALHLSVKTVEKHIKNLKAEGLLRRVGPDKGGHWEVIDT